MIGCLIGIDFGTKRIGLAKSAENSDLALPWRSFAASCAMNQTIDELLKLTRPLQPALFVVGLPLTLRGEDSHSTALARVFIDQLQKRVHPIAVIPWDERLTSAENERLLINLGFKRKKRLELADSLAATTILQSYIDAQKNRFAQTTH